MVAMVSASADARTYFTTWNTKSWVNNHDPLPERDRRFLPFSLALVPAASHRSVMELGPVMVYRVLEENLRNKLGNTASLEIDLVNQVLHTLIQTGFGFELPRQVYRDGRKIKLDEELHAFESVELLDEGDGPMIEHEAMENPSPFLATVRRLARNSEARDRGLVRLLATVVSETLITGALSHVVHDELVDPRVRRYHARHHLDESRHNAFFAGLFSTIWPQMSQRQREQVVPKMATLMRAFCLPDSVWQHRSLIGLGYSQHEARAIVCESCEAADLDESVRAASASTLRAMRRAGALEVPAVEDAMFATKLLVG